MPRNDFGRLTMNPLGDISLLNEGEVANSGDNPPPESFVAVVMVFRARNFSRIVVWLPGNFPADDFEALRTTIEALNRRSGTVVGTHYHQDTESAFLVCPGFPCDCREFTRQCTRAILDHPRISGCSVELNVDISAFQRTFDIPIQVSA